MNVASSYQLLKALVAKGLVPECRRVVIDAEIGEPLKLYVETFGTEETIDVIAAELKPVQVMQHSAYEEVLKQL